MSAWYRGHTVKRLVRIVLTLVGCLALSSFVVSCSSQQISPTMIWTKDHPQATGEYVLQQGDRIEVRHILDGSFSATRVLPPDGQIELPGIHQSIQATGQTIPDLHETLQKLYRSSGVLADPSFTLTLSSVANRNVFIGGEVLRPGVFAITGTGRSVIQGLMARGGPLSTAQLDEVAVIRVTPGGELHFFLVDVAKVLDGSDLSQNIALAPMDIIVVPKTQITRFDVWVDQYVRQVIPVPFSLSLELTAKPFYVPY